MTYVSPWVRNYAFYPDSSKRRPPRRRPSKKIPIKDQPLSERQRQALDFIISEVEAGKRFPMVKEIRWLFGNGESTFADAVLLILRHKGYVEKMPKGFRDKNGHIVRWRLIPESLRPIEHGTASKSHRPSHSQVHPMRQMQRGVHYDQPS